MKNVKEIDLNKFDLTKFKKKSSGCLILTKDNKILLQERDQYCPLFSWHISTKFFWHDKSGILTDKYNEGFQKIFQNYKEVLSNKKLVDDIPWLINKCVDLGYIF